MLYKEELYDNDVCDLKVEFAVQNTIKYIKKIRELEEHFLRIYVIDLFNKSIKLNDIELLFIREVAIQRAKEFFQYVNGNANPNF